MREVKVNAENGSYSILIGENLLKDVGLYARHMGYGKAAVITDDAVAELYLDLVKTSLEAEGVETCSVILPAGEESKCHECLLQIYEGLIDGGIGRDGLLVALGGGVIGDIAGFAAATYMRGVDFIQVPTTLLAQVDSSVGGKVAVNMPQAKNIIGAFYQPKLVLADTATLKTLPQRQVSAGMAEVIKYAGIADAAMEEKIYAGDFSELVCRSCEIKAEYVHDDPYDKGRRMELNFGHTIGHGIETETHYSLLHGEGVAIGMAAVAKIGEAMGVTQPGTYETIARMLDRWKLPRDYETHRSQAVLQAMKKDKKSAGGEINVILLEKLGKARPVKMTAQELYNRLLQI